MSDFIRAARAPWLATPLFAAATLAGLSVLSFNIEFGDWVGTTVTVFAVVVAAIMISRIVMRNRVLPTLIGIAVALVVMVPTYARDGDGRTFTLPTLEALRALAQTFRRGVTFAIETTAPAPADNGLIALVTGIFLAVFLVSEHIAVSWRFTASAGLVLLLPWAYPIVASTRVNEIALMIVLALWIGSMALTRTDAGHQRRHNFGSGFLATVAMVVVTLIAVPTALSSAGWGWQAGLTTPDSFTGGATRLNLALDLRNSLTANSDTPTIVYTTDGRKPDALKLYTYADFDGAAWDRTPATPTTRPADSGVLWPVKTGWNPDNTTRLDIAIQGLTESNLPLPTTPRSVEVDGDWTYQSTLDEVVSDDTNTRGLQYVVHTDLNFHNANDLRAAEGLIVADQSPDGNDPRYVALAPAINVDQVRELAESLTADSTTRYDKAVAIQSYLRNTQNFTYDTSVNPRTKDAVSAFLDDRSGYCVQFATTMIVMLRSLDIPARLSVGFLPGTEREARQFVVTGADAHAWPEVYFPGHGWVRFEPTPAVQTGALPQWADPYSVPGSIPPELLHGQFPGQAGTGNGRPDIDTENPGNLETDPTSGVPVVLIAVIAIILAAGAGAFLLYARRTHVFHRGSHAGPEAAWERLRFEVGDAAWALSLTPFEARQHVAKAIEEAAEAPMSENGASALRSLAQSVSLYRYGPTGVEVSQAQLDAWVNHVVAEVKTAREATARPARGDGRTALQSAP